MAPHSVMIGLPPLKTVAKCRFAVQGGDGVHTNGDVVRKYASGHEFLIRDCVAPLVAGQCQAKPYGPELAQTLRKFSALGNHARHP